MTRFPTMILYFQCVQHLQLVQIPNGTYCTLCESAPDVTDMDHRYDFAFTSIKFAHETTAVPPPLVQLVTVLVTAAAALRRRAAVLPQQRSSSPPPQSAPALHRLRNNVPRAARRCPRTGLASGAASAARRGGARRRPAAADFCLLIHQDGLRHGPVHDGHDRRRDRNWDAGLHCARQPRRGRARWRLGGRQPGRQPAARRRGRAGRRVGGSVRVVPTAHCCRRPEGQALALCWSLLDARRTAPRRRCGTMMNQWIRWRAARNIQNMKAVRCSH